MKKALRINLKTAAYCVLCPDVSFVERDIADTVYHPVQVDTPGHTDKTLSPF
jgi:hypothetical protein